MISIFWINAFLGLVCVLLYGYRSGWLLVKGLQQTWAAKATRIGLFLVLCFVSSGALVRAVNNDPVLWFHWGIMISLVIADVGLFWLMNKGGNDPT